ncbi:alpha-galactosidase-like protein [Medicago truncatula]|uniref:alpha-galactosidase n=1 Tax=Medicago truncatula TaxID=3880 RepID=A0A072V153_MEDTR|nr:alpha-galactosidase-like protein [Medicago truncatula]
MLINSHGVQGRKVQAAGIDGCSQVWAGPLSGNCLAVALWNRCSRVATITALWAALGLESGIHVSVRNLWTVHFHSIYSIFLCTVDQLHPSMGFGR